MRDYDQSSDEELILRLRAGENDITDYIMEKYKGLVLKDVGSMFILGAGKEDLIQEGMIGLFKAIRDYDLGRDASFYTFANLCIMRQIYTAIDAADRKKHIPLNTYVSLYEVVHKGHENGEEHTAQMVEHYVFDSNPGPEELVIGNETADRIEKRMNEDLSKLERQVIDLLLIGMKAVEMSKILNVSEKSIDNAIQRAKNKVKKIMDELRKED